LKVIDLRVIFPLGKMIMIAISNTAALGELIKTRRSALGLRQQDLAMAANVGVRFIVDIEAGKETSQIGLVLRLLQALGIRIEADVPAAPTPSGTTENEETFDPDSQRSSP
jgi:HTH-type transcriptional regulator / antitoxin HipB